jgi:hypothetical protein
LSKLHADRGGLDDTIGSLDQTVNRLKSSEVVLKERMKRGEDRLAATKVEVSYSDREMLNVDTQ